MSGTDKPYGSAYLYSEDLLSNREYRMVDAEISKVAPPGTLKTADKKLIDKWTIFFKGMEKALVLCKTNASIIHFVTGEEPGDDWIGHTVTLQVRMVESFGEMVPAIRVIPPDGVMVRKNVRKRLGTKAVWKGPPKPKQTLPVTASDDYAAQIAAAESQEQLSDLGQAISDDPDLTQERKGELRKLFAERKSELNQE